METLIDTFHIDVKLIIAQLINFTVVFIVLYYFAFKPLGKLMKKRRQEIESGLDAAKQSEIKLADTEAEYKRVIAEARKEAQEIVTAVKQESHLKGEELMDTAKEKVRLYVESAKQQMNADREQMFADVQKEVGELVVEATRKVVGDTVDVKIDKKLVDAAVAAK